MPAYGAGDRGLSPPASSGRQDGAIAGEIVEDGREDTSSEAVKPWAGALENYTLRDVDGKTEVLVEMDSNDEHKEMFETTWPRALERLRDLAEA